MAIPRAAPPLECRIPCLHPPSTHMPREQWEAAVFTWGADCATVHRHCVQGLKP